MLPIILHSRIGKHAADRVVGPSPEGRTGWSRDPERRQSENPDAHLPPLLEAVAPADDRGPTLPSVQVAGLEHAAPDAHPAARLPPLWARVEAAPRRAVDVSEVQVAAMADAKRSGLNETMRMTRTPRNAAGNRARRRAIYARKSTKQVRDAEDKSVTTQVENARAFAAARGWTVDDAHVYVDDAISGAETTKLANRKRCLDAIAAGDPPFQVLLMRDQSRFSRRDGDEAFAELKAIKKAGVQIHYYGDGSTFEYGTLATNVVGFMKSEIAAEYRRQIASMTAETLRRKATAGHVTGGHVFGYDIVSVNSHKERRVNAAEAAIVVRACELYASGVGYATIASTLNAEGAPAPRTWQDPTSVWSAGSVRELVNRPLYRGEIVYGRTKKRNIEGKVEPTKRAPSDWIRVPAPELRILSPEPLGRRRGAHRFDAVAVATRRARAAARPTRRRGVAVRARRARPLWRLRRLDGSRLVEVGRAPDLRVPLLSVAAAGRD